MKATILLPDLNQKVTLQRGEMMFWLRRGVAPKWYAALYIQRGQDKITSDEMAERVSDASIEEMQQLLAFDNDMVLHALKGTGVAVEDLSAEDYEIVLDFAKNGSIPGQEESESVADVLETFRAES